MSGFIIMLLSAVGALFTLLASIGILKMPDTFLRISVTTKAATLGSGFILIAAGLHFASASVSTRVAVIIFFILITAPVSGHLISRAAYRAGNKLWKGTSIDELEGRYDDETGKLS